MRIQGTAPFSSDIWPVSQNTTEEQQAELLDQFPASFRIEEDLVAPHGVPSPLLLSEELDPQRLHGITNLLWLAGRPVPPRPLHRQVMLDREIVVSERIDVHLVWGRGRIFIKPLPRYLLNPRFWRTHLVCRCPPAGNCTCQRRRLRGCALGLLLHHAALITHESDYVIAIEKHLIPTDITWPRWRRFVAELLSGMDTTGGGSSGVERVYAGVAERFVYGELRLNRLNLIQLVLRSPMSGGFLAMWHSYGSFYRDNAAVIIGGAAWLLLILSAMQVGLATRRLSEHEAFQAASYGFSVFSILGPMAALAIVLIAFAVAILYNMLRTLEFEAQRARKLGKSWRKSVEKPAEGV